MVWSKLEAWWGLVWSRIQLKWGDLSQSLTFFDIFLYAAMGAVVFGIVMFYFKLKRPAYRQVGFDLRVKKEDLVQVHGKGTYGSQFDLTEEKTRRIKSMAKAKVGDKNLAPEPRPDAERMKEATLQPTISVVVNPKKNEALKKKANEIRGAKPNLDIELKREEGEQAGGSELEFSKSSRSTGETRKINELARKKIDEVLSNTSITRELEKKGIKKEEIDLEVLESSGVLDGLLDTMVSSVRVEESDIGKFSKMTLDIDLIFDCEDFKKPKK